MYGSEHAGCIPRGGLGQGSGRVGPPTIGESGRRVTGSRRGRWAVGGLSWAGGGGCRGPRARWSRGVGQGRKANWEIYTGPAGATDFTQFTRAARDDPKKGFLGKVGDALKIIAPIAVLMAAVDCCLPMRPTLM